MPNHKSEVTTPSDREIAVKRSFDAPRERVFDAFMQPDLVRRWMNGPEGWKLEVCEIEPRPGGEMRYVWRGSDGEEMGLSGRIRELEPPARTVHTELFDEDWTGGETLVTTKFDEQGGRTDVTTTMLYASKDVRDSVLQSGMSEGMESTYRNLDAFLAEETGTSAGAQASAP